ncbi:uncharacterized protein [Medicago truncatula]|uniref:uncharacterized protein isoform X3 n=1 Tax=Medicago truncatula TaxID=3880 RepID=UPI00196722FC|nr:uncharacterized protein LOC11428900 isoform X3 [Medicago truncatula]
MAMLYLSHTLNSWSCCSTFAHTTYFTTLPHRSRYNTCSFAKKSKREGPEAFVDLSDDKFVQNDNLLDTSLNPPVENANPIPSRSAVLQACILTSALIAAFGTVIRQVSHVASIEGLPVLDCSTEVSFGFEMWHLELITGIVVLISSSRYLLLKTWPDFAESSKAANRQVLSSLQPLDYIAVAVLPGIRTTFPRCSSATFGNELDEYCGQPLLVLHTDMLQFYPLALQFPWHLMQ